MYSSAFVTRNNSFSKSLLKKRKEPQGSRGRIGRPKEARLTRLPELATAPEPEREELFLKKLRQCHVIFDFIDPNEDPEGKEVKRSALSEILDYVDGGQVRERAYPEIIKMVSANLFRPLPPSENCNFDPDMEDPPLDASWPHLVLVYKILVRFLVTADFGTQHRGRTVDREFVRGLLHLFDTEDPRERDLLKITLHSIYSNFIQLRPYIRSRMLDAFLGFTYESRRLNGVAELLEILGSVINGFVVPLKPEHGQILTRVLIPLHKAGTLRLFHQKLAYCVLLFVDKEPTLGEPAVRGLLRYWPKTCSQKEVLFLNELEDLLVMLDPDIFIRLQVPLFQRLSRCVSSPHYQVAERSLSFWHNKAFLASVRENDRVIMPIMFPGLFRGSKEHWSKNVITLVCEVLKTFMVMNGNLFDDLIKSYREERSKERMREREREHKWKILDELAERNVSKLVSGIESL